MKRTTVELPDELDKRLRVKVAEKYGGRKGALGDAFTIADFPPGENVAREKPLVGDAIREAIELWLEKQEG